MSSQFESLHTNTYVYLHISICFQYLFRDDYICTYTFVYFYVSMYTIFNFMAIFMPFCVILALFILLRFSLSAFLMVLRTACILSFVFRSFFLVRCCCLCYCCCCCCVLGPLRGEHSALLSTNRHHGRTAGRTGRVDD